MQGAADGKQQAEKPAAQKRRHAIGRHAEPDDSNADAGGKNVVAEKEKLLSQAIQKSVKGGLRIEQGTEEGKRKQHLPQCRAVIDDIADFVWKNGKQRRRPEPDDRGKKEGGGNGFADAGILLDGAGLGNSGTRETDAAIRQAEGRRTRALPSCQLTVGGEGLDGILPWSCSCLGIRRFSTVERSEPAMRLAESGRAVLKIMARTAGEDSVGLRMNLCFLL